MTSLPATLTIIGRARSLYTSAKDAPFQGSNEITEIEIEPEFSDGLKDIDGFSHLHVFYWLHESKGYSLVVTTPWEKTPHGLFAVRSPHRPNPIGYAVVKLLERNKTILKVEGLDAINGTPILDIKPYIRAVDAQPNAVSGWAENTALKRK